MVADAVKEELMFMRELQVYHDLDQSGLKAIGTRWVYTNKGDAANLFIQARLGAQETKRVNELTPEDASRTFAATLPLESLNQGDAQSMHDGNGEHLLKRKFWDFTTSGERIFTALHVALS